MGKCIDVWDIQKYGGCTGGIQMYGGHTGVYRCTGSIQIYGGVHKYGEHTDVWGCKDGMYRCTGGIQMYGGVQMNGGVQMWPLPPKHTDSQMYPPHSFKLHLGTIFLIKFKFVPYRHTLLAYQLA